ncbi:MAG TPA: hypothetical protein VNJ08_00365 [Bacteriovoracaceae bacterium]|nr:hypothetical protein [Bacteriovoracaceae bacterium]
MKFILVFIVLSTFFTVSAFAGETTTECPMMREANERNNPKATLSNVKVKLNKTKTSASKQ